MRHEVPKLQGLCNNVWMASRIDVNAGKVLDQLVAIERRTSCGGMPLDSLDRLEDVLHSVRV